MTGRNTLIHTRDHHYELTFLRQRMSALARGRASDRVEDLAMEAWVVLDRVLRREAAQNLDALMSRIARFVWIDCMRQRKPLIEDFDVDAIAMAPPLPGIDPSSLALFRFAVLEYFVEKAPKCHELAQHYFAGRNWFQVAEHLGEKRDAIAKRWERCAKNMIAAFRASPGPLRDLLTELEGVMT